MYASLKKKRAGEWVTFDEKLGVGDGEARAFSLPDGIGPERIAVLRHHQILAPGNTFRPINETSTGPDGTIRRVFGSDVKDGYRIERLYGVDAAAGADSSPPEGVRFAIVFDRAPDAGTPLGFSRLGVKIDHPGLSFQILPLSKKLSNRLSDTLPKRRGQSEHEWSGDTPARVKELNHSRAEAFVTLVTDWTLREKETGEAIECTEENRTLFAEQMSPLYGQFVLDRSVDLAAGLADELESDRKN